jgi:F-type H+-transporting ATPase subunit c
MRKFVLLFLVMAAMSVFAMPAFAQGSEAPVSGATWVNVASGLALAFAAGLAALGQGRVAGSACESFARNPGARQGIQLALILGLAFIESLVLFVVVFVRVLK